MLRRLEMKVVSILVCFSLHLCLVLQLPLQHGCHIGTLSAQCKLLVVVAILVSVLILLRPLHRLKAEAVATWVFQSTSVCSLCTLQVAVVSILVR